MFDCCVVRLSPHFRKKKSNFLNGQKSCENRTNIDIILSFLAKPVDKHGITLVFFPYPPLQLMSLAGVIGFFTTSFFTTHITCYGHDST